MTMTTEQLVALASERAIAARKRAYAPYSNFAMGAAAVTADGFIVEGVLIENVSLGLAMCADPGTDRRSTDYRQVFRDAIHHQCDGSRRTTDPDESGHVSGRGAGPSRRTEDEPP